MDEKRGQVEKSEFSGGNLTKSSPWDAGLDVKSAENITLWPRTRTIVSTGLKIKVPNGFVGLLWSRSGLSAKHGIEVGAGCIDSTYRGEVRVVLHNHSDEKYCISKGDRIAQLLTIPVMLTPYIEVERLDDTERGDGGFGSSGK